MVKPFLKWAGGKSQILNEIQKKYPSKLGGEINKYCEPFIGGGAVLFDIINNYELDEIYISDINKELLNCYIVIKKDVYKLIELLEKYEKEFIILNEENRKEYYINKREIFNKIKLQDDFNNIEKAAIMIFLNKTCFNGLYRVNKKGFFNVPMGNYKNPKICDKENLILLSKKLENINVKYGDYTKSFDFVDENTFVYFDPPYRPLSKTSSFTSYNENIFDDNEQIRLSEYFSLLDKKGAKLLLSNSDPKNSDINDDFFDNLYKDFEIKRIVAKRMINSKGNSRGIITEILVSNYIGEKI